MYVSTVSAMTQRNLSDYNICYAIKKSSKNSISRKRLFGIYSVTLTSTVMLEEKIPFARATDSPKSKKNERQRKGTGV